MANINKTASNMDFPLQIARQYSAPIDKYEVFYSYEEASSYASSNPIAYVGQTIKVVDEDSNTVASYVINDTSGTLKQLAVGDDTSGLTSRVTELESEMTQAQSDITELQSNMTQAQSDITELKSDLSTLDSQAFKVTGGTITGDVIIAKSGSSGGNLTVAGDLTVQGKTTQVSVEDLAVKDNLIITNSDGASLGANLSGLAIMTDPTNAYAIVYDPSSSSVKLGQGSISSSTKEFTFKAGEGEAVTTRADASSMTDGQLVQWDATNTRIVTSGVAASELARADDIPTGFNISATSSLLKATGGNNSVTFDAYPPAEAGAGLLSKDASGNLVYGGSIVANGTTLTGNQGTVTQIIGGDGLSGGTITDSGTISHAIPSGASAATTGGEESQFISSITTDKFGHITDVTTAQVVLDLVKVEALTMSGSEDTGYTYTSSSAGYTPVAVINSDGKRVTFDSKDTETGFIITTDISITGNVVSVKTAL